MEPYLLRFGRLRAILQRRDRHQSTFRQPHLGYGLTGEGDQDGRAAGAGVQLQDVTDLAAAFGPERQVAVCRELTKTYEEVLRGTAGEIAAVAAERELRGEITVVVAGEPPRAAAEADGAELRILVDALVADGLSRRDAVTAVADETGVARKRVYAAATA